MCCHFAHLYECDREVRARTFTVCTRSRELNSLLDTFELVALWVPVLRVRAPHKLPADAREHPSGPVAATIAAIRSAIADDLLLGALLADSVSQLPCSVPMTRRCVPLSSVRDPSSTSCFREGVSALSTTSMTENSHHATRRSFWCVPTTASLVRGHVPCSRRAIRIRTNAPQQTLTKHKTTGAASSGTSNNQRQATVKAHTNTAL